MMALRTKLRKIIKKRVTAEKYMGLNFGWALSKCNMELLHLQLDDDVLHDNCN